MAEQGTANAEPTPEVPEGGAVAEPEAPKVVEESKPDFLDPRFKSVEDQAKAYREAEKMAQQKSQRAAELERQNQELLMRQQQAATVTQPEPNYDELFWQKPTEVIENLLGKRIQAAVQPFIEGGYKAQKAKYANDPDFKKYEPMIDQLTAAQPNLKTQDGAVDQLYRIARAMDPEYEVRTEERLRQQIQQKIGGSVEGAGTPGEIKATPKVELSAEEQGIARKFYPELTPQEAHKQYHSNKARMMGGA